MPLSMYQASVPVLLRGLGVLSTLLEKGAAHAAASGIDPAELVQARLAPDMLTLAGQVQRASDTSKFAAARLSGLPAPSFPDEEASVDDLLQRVAATVEFLQSVPAEAFEGSEGRSITYGPQSRPTTLPGADYLLGFALPNFYFHVTTAYDILRHLGAPIGKRDYLGPLGTKG
ncbi:DUF1993 domain-containing protein [Roseomonas sp. SG15]|uniref:DUF1993 domain-containing protein n=2 Tax=Roseomonas indoligenes TaxID=2820811 RepID=A0A940S5W7_9PROT|nr:DUF1993 domain-containing protein [Pararoseomonas indoligenes]MBP0494876.1 DUF1993 domain-containing protein [Pararoseomonas indoligenes]